MNARPHHIAPSPIIPSLIPSASKRQSTLRIIGAVGAIMSGIITSCMLCTPGVAANLTAGISESETANAQDSDKTVIVIRDVRLVTPEEFAKRERAKDESVTEEQIQQRYGAHLATVRKVRREQYAVARKAMQQYGVKKLFIEAVPEKDLAKHSQAIKTWADQASKADEMLKQAQAMRQALDLRRQTGQTDGDYNELVEKLRDVQAQVVAYGMEELQYGVAARLMAADDLELELAALDTVESLELYNPDSAPASDDAEAKEKMAEREKLLAKTLAEWLKEHNTAILVLSGETDLRDEFRDLDLEVQYGAATVPSFPK